MAFEIRSSVVAVAALALAAPAFAADMPGQVTNEVRVTRAAVQADSPAGADLVLSRLGRAAMEACGASTFSVRDHQAAVRRSDCWHTSMANAVSQVGNPVVSDAFHRRASVEVARSEGAAVSGLR